MYHKMACTAAPRSLAHPCGLGELTGSHQMHLAIDIEPVEMGGYRVLFDRVDEGQAEESIHESYMVAVSYVTKKLLELPPGQQKITEYMGDNDE